MLGDDTGHLATYRCQREVLDVVEVGRRLREEGVVAPVVGCVHNHEGEKRNRREDLEQGRKRQLLPTL